MRSEQLENYPGKAAFPKEHRIAEKNQINLKTKRQIMKSMPIIEMIGIFRMGFFGIMNFFGFSNTAHTFIPWHGRGDYLLYKPDL